VHIQLVSADLEIEQKPDSYTVMYFLNRAQEKYLKENFLSEGNLQDNIEHIQKRSDTLRNLIKRFEGTESTPAIEATEADGGIELGLPTDYLYYIKSFSYATNGLTSPVTKIWTPNRVVGHDEVDKIISGLFNTPILRKPCIVFEEGDKVVLYKDVDTSIYNIGYIYLRKPLNLSLDATDVGTPAGLTDECELSDYTHQDIVELAVSLFIEDFKFKASRPNQ